MGGSLCTCVCGWGCMGKSGCAAAGNCGRGMQRRGKGKIDREDGEMAYSRLGAVKDADEDSCCGF